MARSPRASIPFREKGGLTRMMVLRALSKGDTRPLRDIADEIGVTAQAVSEHMKRLQEDGLVASGGSGPRLTQEGIETLREGLSMLKQYVDGAVREIARIEQTSARAGATIRQGDAVGLFMEAGELVAYPGRDSPSHGRALQDAQAGDDLLVDSLQGIVRLEPGRVTFGVVQDAAAGGSRKTDLPRARAAAQDHGLVVVLGPVARRIAEHAGVTAVRFGGVPVAVDAAVRGVSALVLVEAAGLADAEAQFHDTAQAAGLAVVPQVLRLDR